MEGMGAGGQVVSLQRVDRAYLELDAVVSPLLRKAAVLSRCIDHEKT